jgi:hypothetical protein
MTITGYRATATFFSTRTVDEVFRTLLQSVITEVNPTMNGTVISVVLTNQREWGEWVEQVKIDMPRMDWSLLKSTMVSKRIRYLVK